MRILIFTYHFEIEKTLQKLRKTIELNEQKLNNQQQLVYDLIQKDKYSSNLSSIESSDQLLNRFQTKEQIIQDYNKIIQLKNQEIQSLQIQVQTLKQRQNPNLVETLTKSLEINRNVQKRMKEENDNKILQIQQEFNKKLIEKQQKYDQLQEHYNVLLQQHQELFLLCERVLQKQKIKSKTNKQTQTFEQKFDQNRLQIENQNLLERNQHLKQYLNFYEQEILKMSQK